jgi:leucyl-tRNA synthetase
MEALNALYKLDSISVNTVENFLLLLSPLAPHISEEIWNRLGRTGTLAYESWPIADSKYLIEDTYELPIQVNGKVRGKLTFNIDQDRDTVITLAKEEPSIAKYISGSEIVKTIYVEKRILNFVTKK